MILDQEQAIMNLSHSAFNKLMTLLDDLEARVNPDQT